MGAGEAPRIGDTRGQVPWRIQTHLQKMFSVVSVAAELGKWFVIHPGLFLAFPNASYADHVPILPSFFSALPLQKALEGDRVGKAPVRALVRKD